MVKKYIFRCKDSGVFYGELGEQNGQTCKIINSRKIHTWYGANCCEELSINGTTEPLKCLITVPANNEVYDLIQKLECSEKAIASLDGVKEWKIG